MTSVTSQTMNMRDAVILFLVLSNLLLIYQVMLSPRPEIHRHRGGERDHDIPLPPLSCGLHQVLDEASQTCKCRKGFSGLFCNIPDACKGSFSGNHPKLCEHSGTFDEASCQCMCEPGWSGERCEDSVPLHVSELKSYFHDIKERDAFGENEMNGCIGCTISKTTLSPDPIQKPTSIFNLTFNSAVRSFMGNAVPLEVDTYPNFGGLSLPTRYSVHYATLKEMTVQSTLPQLGGLVDLAPAVAYHIEPTFASKYPDSIVNLQVNAFQLYRMRLPFSGKTGVNFDIPITDATQHFFDYLPKTFSTTDKSILDKWMMALDTWGTSVLIESVIGGMHARIITSTPYFDNPQELHVELCLGGNAGSNLDCGEVEKWKASILVNPSVIRYRSVPLSEFAPAAVQGPLNEALSYYQGVHAKSAGNALESCPPECHNGGTCASPSFRCECPSAGEKTFEGTTCATPEYHMYNSSEHDTKLTPASTTTCALQYGVSLVQGYKGGAVVYISLCGLFVRDDGYWHMTAVAFNGNPFYCLAYCKPLAHTWS